MIGDAARNLRPQGARASAPADGEAGPPRTLQGSVEAKFLIVGFFDEVGRSQTAVVMEVNGKYYMPPNAVEWCASAKPVSKWLTDALSKSEDAKAPVDLPESDRVDVA